MKPVAAWKGAGFTFNWPDYRRVSFSLAGFLLLSILIHGLAFYVFQIVYPPTASIAPPPAQVSILTPDTPQNRELLDWIDAYDPALLAQPQEAAPPGLLQLPYVPSFAGRHAEPIVPAPAHPRAEFPAALSPGALIESALPGENHRVQPVAPQPTATRFSGVLGDRARVSEPPWKLKPAPAAQLLVQARFLLGVNADGAVDYIFVQESSGDDAMDRHAASHLQAIRFAPAENAIEWGFARVLWGADAFAPSDENKPSEP